MRSSANSRFLLLCSLSLFSILLALADCIVAQERKAGVSGHVTDNSGAVLQGARIELQPLGLIAVSDSQGSFFINNVEPGSYTLMVTYVGFKDFTKQVNVAAGQIASVEAKLEVSSQSLEVLVTAERALGEAEELNRQRNADNIVQVLTSDVIRSLPNANMADALGRLPSVTLERDEGEGKYVQIRGTEPRLANVTIDGVNVPSPDSSFRQIKLDTIPADLVESVEINKTLQANMDGDGIGGSVNLVTKTPGERPTVSLSGMGGYSAIIGGVRNTEATGTVGKRFGRDKRFGTLIGGSYDWNGRGIDDIEPVPDIATNLPGQPRWFDTMDIREYKYYRSRWGLAGSADYKLAEGSSVYIRGLYSDFKNFGDRWVYTVNDNTDPAAAGLLNGNGGTPSFNTQIRRQDFAIGSLVVGGKHVFSTTWYSWDVSASRSRLVEEGFPTASFDATNLDSSACTYDPAATKQSYRPQWKPVCFTEAYNTANYTLTRIQNSTGLAPQLNLQFAAAMAKRYHVGSRLANIEVGGKFRNAHKFDNVVRFTFRPTGSVPLAQFPSRFSNDNYYDSSYQLGPNPSYQDVFAFYTANQSSFTTSTDYRFQFNYVEKVSAGYVMNTIDFNGVRFIAGVRIEGTNLDSRNPIVNPARQITGFRTDSGSYITVLPSASVRFALTTNANLRLVYSRGMSRPDAQSIAQAVSIDDSVTPNRVTLGNPNLKAESAQNADVLFEYYLNPFGTIQAGYFYKSLSDPIVSQTCVPPTVCQPFPGSRVTQPINAGSGWVSGFEAAYLQHLAFLPGPLRGLGVSANYGYTASRANGLPGRSDHPRLLRSAPHTWNISPTYDRGRISARLGLSYNAANIFSYQFSDGTPGGINGPLGDQYFYPHLQIDAQGSVRLKHRLSFIAYGLNLNNEVFGFYFGSPQYMIQREFYSPHSLRAFAGHQLMKNKLAKP